MSASPARRGRRVGTVPVVEVPHYECQRGHKQQGEEWSYQVYNQEDKVTIVDSGPLCHECWAMPELAAKIAAFACETIGTRRVATPAKGKRRKGSN